MNKQQLIHTVGTAVLCAVVSLGAVALRDYTRGGAGSTPPAQTEGTSDVSRIATPLSGTGEASGSAAGDQYIGADVAEAVMPSVVGVAAGEAIDNRSRADRDKSVQWSMGSGIIVSKNGYILTNQHVVTGSDVRLMVTLADGATAQAKHVWSDAQLDLAIIKINASGLTPASLGNANTLRVGEGVLAIGNPLSMQFQRTVTGGLVSAVGRSVSLTAEDGSQYYMDGLVQTDASINPGNSGGPLVNLAGEVVGINTIKVSSAEGIGFAIPINIARPIIEACVSGRGFVTPRLGLYARDNAMSRYMGAEYDADVGVVVVSADRGGAAYRAGIREGDIITHVDKKEVNTMNALREEVFRHPDGCTFTYISDGQVRETHVTPDR